MIWLIGISVIVIYIIINVSIDIGKKRDYEKAFDNACNLQAASNREYLSKKQEILSKIESYYGKDMAVKLEKGTITTGMHKALVKFAYGKPEDIREEYKYGNRIERWYYNGYVNRLGNIKYKLELLIENDRLEGWKDL